VSWCRHVCLANITVKEVCVRKVSSIFCTDIHEVLLLPVVNAVNILILCEMLFILDHAPCVMACLVLAVYLFVHFI